MQRIAVNPGKVEWSGENPGIYLKADADQDYSTVALFFRIALSPHGRGVGAIILGDPDTASGYPTVPNLCLTDNRVMMEYLLENFASKFPTFVGKAGVEAMSWHDITQSRQDNHNMPHSYSEELQAGDVKVQMTWKDLQAPMAVEVGPPESATKAHDMYAVFLEARDAHITINGEVLPGRVVDRQFFGRTMSTAFLAISETWVSPS
ncbi:hypothetical protein N9W44_03445 [Alphaproteobacteria bacterium]|nr:hypothetical protein [Alphaproteobacteria bacterium]